MTKKKILIIEDEKALLEAIKSKLLMSGYDVISAEDGEDGENLLKSETPDLVLLDILLPKKDGFQILEDLKKDGIIVPIVIISNSGQPVEIERALQLGVKDYLVKANFTPNEVLEKVEKTIGKGISSSDDASANPANDIVAQSSGIPVSQKSDTVLIVEDDEFLRQLVAQKLTQEGFNVIAAIDATEAFKSIHEKQPQIILLDLILPGMDGYEILDQLKKDSFTKSIPVIVLSNLGQREDIDKALKAGANDYLIKANFTPGEIVEKVRNVLKKNYL
ncbi:MAG: response regulator [bacterium]|nr:response regulator [bacterium]